MWKFRSSKDYFESEGVDGTRRECISKRTIKEFLDRLGHAETWLLKYLLGENHVVRAGAVNVKVIARMENGRTKNYFGDLYVVQNLENQKVSFKLYSPEDNQFIWSADTDSSLKGYLDLASNTHVLHLGEVIYTVKFPDKKERTRFRDNINKFLFFEKSKSKCEEVKE